VAIVFGGRDTGDVVLEAYAAPVLFCDGVCGNVCVAVCEYRAVQVAEMVGGAQGKGFEALDEAQPRASTYPLRHA
jgi:hypothetical protein